MIKIYKFIWNIIYKIFNLEHTVYSICFIPIYDREDFIYNIKTLINCQNI